MSEKEDIVPVELQPPQPQEQPKAGTTPYPIVAAVKFNDRPTMVHCPSCNNDIISETSHKVGVLTWVVMAVIFLIGLNLWIFFLCLFFPIPLCVKPLKDVEHTCPVCQYNLGRFKRV